MARDLSQSQHHGSSRDIRRFHSATTTTRQRNRLFTTVDAAAAGCCWALPPRGQQQPIQDTERSTEDFFEGAPRNDPLCPNVEELGRGVEDLLPSGLRKATEPQAELTDE